MKDDEQSVRSAALERARASALAELERVPRVPSWQRDATVAVLLLLGWTVMVMGAGTWLSIVELDRLKGRWLSLVLLTVVQALGILAAVAPGKPMLRKVVALLSVTAAIAILAGRGSGLATTTPALACSTSHLAVDLVPLGLVLIALRRFSGTLGRSLLAGVAAAATGAIAGELSCGRGWSHVLVHHVGTGLALALGCVLLARLRQPETFAP